MSGTPQQSPVWPGLCPCRQFLEPSVHVEREAYLSRLDGGRRALIVSVCKLSEPSQALFIGAVWESAASFGQHAQLVGKGETVPLFKSLVGNGHEVGWAAFPSLRQQQGFSYSGGLEPRREVAVTQGRNVTMLGFLRLVASCQLSPSLLRPYLLVKLWKLWELIQSFQLLFFLTTLDKSKIYPLEILVKGLVAARP